MNTPNIKLISYKRKTFMLEIIFSNFWTWLGSMGLIFIFGYALSLPFYWYMRAMEEKRLVEEQARVYKFYDQRN